MKKRCLSGHRYAVNIAAYESYPDHIDIVAAGVHSLAGQLVPHPHDPQQFLPLSTGLRVLRLRIQPLLYGHYGLCLRHGATDIL